MTPTDTTTPPAAEPEPVDPDDVEMLAEAYDFEANSRLWLRRICRLLDRRSQELDPVPRVQTALDNMYIAACERVGRILHADVDGVEDGD